MYFIVLFWFSPTTDINRANHTIVFAQQSTAFLVNVTIMDLDPKPISHATKYVKQLEQSHVEYNKFKESI